MYFDVFIKWYNPKNNEPYLRYYSLFYNKLEFEKENSYGHYVIGIYKLEEGKLYNYSIVSNIPMLYKNNLEKDSFKNELIDLIIKYLKKKKNR